MKALLLSGGMDSIALAYWHRPEIAITIDYGQRPAAGEIRAAQATAADLGIEHHLISVDLSRRGCRKHYETLRDLGERPY